MNRILARFVSRILAFAGLLMTTVASQPAHAGWTVTILHPAGAGSSLANGGYGTQQVGAAAIGSKDHASLWSGSAASWTDLHPAGYQWSWANATSGAQQCGYALDSAGVAYHAGLWTGTAASWVDLNPTGADSSSAWGISGARQAGSAAFSGASHAGTWSGTAASWVDLNPTGAVGSYAWGISGTQVVGTVLVSIPGDERQEAALWNGAADSWVDLGPGTGSGDAGAGAYATDGTHQVGTLEGRASLWSGTAASLVDLHPSVARGASAALGLFGTQQVGYADFGYYDASTDTYFSNTHASLWNGTAASWEDLSLALAGSWKNTVADSIWSDGTTLYIAGYGNSVTDGRDEAILWSRPISVPEPGGLVLAGLGLLGLGALRLHQRRPMFKMP